MQWSGIEKKDVIYIQNLKKRINVSPKTHIHADVRYEVRCSRALDYFASHT